ncbi:MAG: hypothetical protein ICV64_11660 [Thermoleophilia bacterium]|nr:hypothetical protein [Thermoleophilia bacterium]
MAVRELTVRGYGGASVPCLFHEEERERAAVVFPGGTRSGGRLGGSPARPDLHFTRALLLELGLGVLEVWWDAATKPRASEGWFRENALAAVRAAGGDRVAVLVGRSIGTGALAHLPEWNDRSSLWLAPLTSVRPVREALLAWRGPKLVVAGDADEAFEPVEGVDTVLVRGADHGFDLGDAAASARALADALEGMRRFLSAAGARAAGP